MGTTRSIDQWLADKKSSSIRTTESFGYMHHLVPYDLVDRVEGVLLLAASMAV